MVTVTEMLTSVTAVTAVTAATAVVAVAAVVAAAITVLVPVAAAAVAVAAAAKRRPARAPPLPRCQHSPVCTCLSRRARSLSPRRQANKAGMQKTGLRMFHLRARRGHWDSWTAVAVVGHEVSSLGLCYRLVRRAWAHCHCHCHCHCCCCSSVCTLTSAESRGARRVQLCLLG